MKSSMLATGLVLSLTSTVAGARFLDQAILGALRNSPLDPFADERRELDRAQILKDVFDGNDIDWKFHTVAKWGGNEAKYPGIVLDPNDLGDAPAINLTTPLPKLAPCDPEETFIIAITDPDAPSRDDPKNGEFCHYLAEYACRASGVVTSVLDLEHIKDLVKYTPPAPPSGTGPHRYVIAALNPKNDKESRKRDLTAPKKRKHWGFDNSGEGLQQWAEDNDLKTVGATYFLAFHQGDDKDDVVHEI